MDSAKIKQMFPNKYAISGGQLVPNCLQHEAAKKKNPKTCSSNTGSAKLNIYGRWKDRADFQRLLC